MQKELQNGQANLGTQAQLALALFNEFEPQDLSVRQAPESLGYHRNDAFIEIVDLSLAGRRLIDVAYFLVADEPASEPVYRFDYNLFKFLMGTTSNNRIHFEKAIRDAQKAAIKVKDLDHKDSSKDRWGSIPLMGSAFIVNGEVIFELPERLQRIIKNPGSSHFLSMRYVFSKLYSRVLYDRLLPFLPGGATPEFSLPVLRDWLECTAKTYDAFKYLKSKVLDPAIEEIEAVTGVRVTMATPKVPGTKKVAAVRFYLQKVRTEDTEKDSLHALRTFYEILRREFGLNNEQLNEIIQGRATYTDQRIADAVEYTRFNIDKGVVKKANAYFMKALREGYVVAEADKRIQQRQLELEQGRLAECSQPNELLVRSQQQEQDWIQRRDIEANEVAFATFQALAQSEQHQFFASYQRSLPAKLLCKAHGVAVEELTLQAAMDDSGLRFGLGQYLVGRFKQAA